MTFCFHDHVVLLRLFVDRHDEVVERIESSLLNVQGKAPHARRDRSYFEQKLDTCFFGLPRLAPALTGLKGQLAALQVQDGLEPERRDRFSNDLDPLELIVRAYDYWERSRWPGKSGRLTYARCMFAVFLLRQLERLSLRIWDDGDEGAADRLAEVQSILDGVNGVTAPLAFVRDARWLIATVQSPLTPDIAPYFRIAARIVEAFPLARRLELHAASVKMTSGHLRSQLKYGIDRSGKAADDLELLAFTRNSNAMDNALVVQDLVPLLEAYETASASLDRDRRLDLADAILQGLSADPDLLLTRFDLLAPYTMVEELFLEGEPGSWRYTAMGLRHLQLVQRYVGLIHRNAEALRADRTAFEPREATYSPFGIAYGFSVDLLSNIAMARLVGQPSFDLAFEDTFASGGNAEAKRARAAGWKVLPTRPGEGAHFEHSIDFAALMFERLGRALDSRIAHRDKPNASGLPDARLFVALRGQAGSEAGHQAPADAETAQALCFTSDGALAAAIGGVSWPRHELARERKDGGFLASEHLDGHIFGVSKMVLTSLLAQGKDVVLTDVPAIVRDKLKLTCPGLFSR